jgi:hypothetical protein
VEGGEIPGYDGSEIRWRDAKTRKQGQLALWLVLLLTLTIVGHYLATLFLVLKGREEAEALHDAFNITLPVISGLVSSAVTYYFTREDR